LEIREGISVAIDKIESIETIPEGSRIWVNGIAYETAFPRNILIHFIETGEISKDEQILEQVTKLVDNNQYFAG
jgi:hypothetical protein